MNNHTKTTGLGSSACHNWDIFDSLPREVKEVIWYAPTSLVAPRWIPRVTQDLSKNFADSCKAAYGPDHPGAKWRPKTPSSAEELGF